MNYIANWIKSKGGAYHVALSAFAALQLAYFAVPAFHSLVTTIYQNTPSWAHDVVLSAIGIAALYKNPQKQTDQPKS